MTRIRLDHLYFLTSIHLLRWRKVGPGAEGFLVGGEPGLIVNGGVKKKGEKKEGRENEKCESLSTLHLFRNAPALLCLTLPNNIIFITTLYDEDMTEVSTWEMMPCPQQQSCNARALG